MVLRLSAISVAAGVTARVNSQASLALVFPVYVETVLS